MPRLPCPRCQHHVLPEDRRCAHCALELSSRLTLGKARLTTTGVLLMLLVLMNPLLALLFLALHHGELA